MRQSSLLDCCADRFHLLKPGNRIAGSTAGTGYDQLQITGTATLAGTLNVSLIGGYTPPSGTSFKLLSYGSHSGTFSNVTGTGLPNGLSFALLYNTTDLTLKAS